VYSGYFSATCSISINVSPHRMSGSPAVTGQVIIRFADIYIIPKGMERLHFVPLWPYSPVITTHLLITGWPVAKNGCISIPSEKYNFNFSVYKSS